MQLISHFVLFYQCLVDWRESFPWGGYVHKIGNRLTAVNRQTNKQTNKQTLVGCVLGCSRKMKTRMRMKTKTSLLWKSVWRKSRHSWSKSGGIHGWGISFCKLAENFFCVWLVVRSFVFCFVLFFCFLFLCVCISGWAQCVGLNVESDFWRQFAAQLERICLSFGLPT